MKKIVQLSFVQLVFVATLFTCIYQVLVLRGLPQIVKGIGSILGMEVNSKDLVTSYAMGSIVRLIGVVGIIFILKKSGILDGISKKWKWEYLLFSVVMLAYIVFNFEFCEVGWDKAYIVVIMLVECFVIGLYEEIFFRGLILGGLVKKYGSSTKQRLIAVLISSFLFGLIHILNFFTDDVSLNVVVGQVVYAFFIGVFFGGLYLKTNFNLWWCVVLHGLFDISDQLVSIAGYHGVAAVASKAAEVENIDVVINDLGMLPLFLIGLVLVFKSDTQRKKEATA